MHGHDSSERLRILLVCERLSGRDNEGIKNVARHLVEELARCNTVLALSRREWPERPDVLAVPMNPFFVNRRLLGLARRFRPDATLYVPWTSGTPRTFVRGSVLRLATGAPVAIVLTQPYSMSTVVTGLIRPFLPDLILAMDHSVVEEFRRLGVAAHFLPGGVRLDRFRMLRESQRASARSRLGIGPGERMILHVGHLNRHRLRSEEIAVWKREADRRVVIVGSPDTPQDQELILELEEAGCKVIGDHLPHIEEIYGAADLYWFPRMDSRSSIGVPLSVLEALACGVPVVASPFGALPSLFPSTPYVKFVSSPAETETAIAGAPPAPSPAARALVQEYDWSQIGERVAALLGQARRG